MPLTAVLALLTVATAGAQWPARERSLPPQIPIPGAPTSACDLDHIGAGAPIRITTGEGFIPYQFACGTNRPVGVCAEAGLPAGLVVSLGRVKDGWACVTGGDGTSGWIPAARLAGVPATPQEPVGDWLGWWRHPFAMRGRKNDQLLITRVRGSKLLHVSGRAYWYGLGDDVHFGEVEGDARPIGVYLHVISRGGCVVDLKLDPSTETLDSYDNMDCGGMNVRFLRTWVRFQPKGRED